VTASVTYDTGALVAAERDDRSLWAIHTVYLRANVRPVVPAPVLAEAWRGGAGQARLARLLRGCEVEAMTEAQALRVGMLAGRAKQGDVVDVTVVEGAVRRGDEIVTSDPDDLEAIASAISAHPRIVAI
jgi:hypothetical protein